jgi:Peptidase C39 family
VSRRPAIRYRRLLCALVLASTVGLSGTSRADNPDFVAPDCGLNSLFMLLDLSQKHVDLASLRRALPGQTEEGYSLSELKHAAEALGHRCRAIILERPDTPPNRPAIAYLANGTHGHFIVVRFLGGMGAARAQILDPPSPPFLVDYSNLVADDGVGSARQLDELCRSHSAYQWICGDVSVNYHTLSDFRTDRGELLERTTVEFLHRLSEEVPLARPRAGGP